MFDGSDPHDPRYANRGYEDPYRQDYGYEYGYRRGPSDRVLHDRVHAALDRALGAEARDIAVRVRDRNVCLSGTVVGERERQFAHDVAHSVRGVRQVFFGRLYARRYDPYERPY
jgi:osmotically-inducible protein OsmY